MTSMQRKSPAYEFQDRGGSLYLITPLRKNVLIVGIASGIWIGLLRSTVPIVFMHFTDYWWVRAEDALIPAIFLIIAGLGLIGYSSYLWLRLVLSRQAILISNAEITIRQVIVLGNRTVRLTRPKAYQTKWMSNLRVFPALGFSSKGPFAFDYRAASGPMSTSSGNLQQTSMPAWSKTVQFGSGLNEAEVQEIWTRLEQFLPR